MLKYMLLVSILIKKDVFIDKGQKEINKKVSYLKHPRLWQHCPNEITTKLSRSVVPAQSLSRIHSRIPIHAFTFSSLRIIPIGTGSPGSAARNSINGLGNTPPSQPVVVSRLHFQTAYTNTATHCSVESDADKIVVTDLKSPPHVTPPTLCTLAKKPLKFLFASISCSRSLSEKKTLFHSPRFHQCFDFHSKHRLEISWCACYKFPFH